MNNTLKTDFIDDMKGMEGFAQRGLRNIKRITDEGEIKFIPDEVSSARSSLKITKEYIKLIENHLKYYYSLNDVEPPKYVPPEDSVSKIPARNGEEGNAPVDASAPDSVLA